MDSLEGLECDRLVIGRYDLEQPYGKAEYDERWVRQGQIERDTASQPRSQKGRAPGSVRVYDVGQKFPQMPISP